MEDHINKTVINFSYEPGDITKLICSISELSERGTEIFDFTTTVSKDLEAKVLYPSDKDPENLLHKKAIENYINEMGLLSRAKSKSHPSKSIRDLKIMDLPLYWMTPVSQKNPQDSVLKNFYYFKFLLSEFDLQNKQIYIVLPELCLHFKNAVSSFLIANGVTANQLVFSNVGKSSAFSYRGLFSYIRVFFRKLNKTREKLAKLNLSPDFPEELIITGPGLWKENEQQDVVLWGIEKLAESKNKTVKYLPVFFDYTEVEHSKSSSKFDAYYFSCFPTHFQLLSFYRELIAAFRQVQNIDFDLEGISFADNEALRFEFNSVLHHKLEYFCNYLWLKNYFSKCSRPMNVFYQDEFFNTGRLISESINRLENKYIHSYGVQHGLFYEAHTVYLLTDSELNPLESKDGLPVPNKFIVWGDYFKNLFLANNSLPNAYVIPAGHLDYIYRHQNIIKQSAAQNLNIIKLLWCTTLKVDLVNMYNKVVKGFLCNHPEVHLEIRFHPIVDLEAFCFNDLFDEESKKRITVSRHVSIFSAIESCDIILTNSGSTVFLDGLIAGKPVISFLNNDYYMGDLGKREVEKISDLSTMESTYQEYLSGGALAKKADHLLELNAHKWEAILAPKKNRTEIVPQNKKFTTESK